MRVAVIGAGIVGTLTAYFLNQYDCEVTVYDRATGPAEGTSRANGGQLSYSFCDAMADPQLVPKLPGILLGLDPAFRIGFSLKPEFIRWGLGFLTQCRRTARDQNTKQLLEMAIQSSNLMASLSEQFGKASSFDRSGKLVLMDQAPTRELVRRVKMKNEMGLEARLLGTEEIFEIEPNLKSLSRRPQAAIYSPQDEVANAHSFTRCLASYLQNRGVNFKFGETIHHFSATDAGCAVSNETGRVCYDAVVLATGDGAGPLLSQHGIKLPVLPMYGYSWTFPANENSPTASVTALSKKLVFSRLGDKVRVAGFADVNPRKRDKQKRSDTLREVAKQLLPEAADYDRPVAEAWRGARAMTPSSLPILGKSPIPNVYTNLGHGMLGWTLGASTSELVARQVAGRA